MEIYTIGFTQKTAADFFTSLRRVGIRRLIDVRLNNRSQLAGFAKQDDLRFFLAELCDADYVHEPLLAPTEEILHNYRKKIISWQSYEQQFLDLMKERKVEAVIDRRSFLEPTVLLCSEAKAEYCHRRLVAEYLGRKWGGAEIIHL